MKVRYVSKTSSPDFEDIESMIAYIARVSNPASDQEKQTMPVQKLIKYCIDHKHWSPFEMADMTVEITTSRAIAAQILRHKSFSFQEFSQRYSVATETEFYMARRQDTKNRQSSLDDLSIDDKMWFGQVQNQHAATSFRLYNEAIGRGIAKECARFLLPMATQTKLYMKGSVRSWLHYIDLRTDPGTQFEHRIIAEKIQGFLYEHFPIISESMWGLLHGTQEEGGLT